MNALIARIALAALVVGVVGLGLAQNGDAEVPGTQQESDAAATLGATETAEHGAGKHGAEHDVMMQEAAADGGMKHGGMMGGADHEGMMQMMEMMAHCSSMMAEMHGESSGHGMGNMHGGDDGSGAPR